MGDKRALPVLIVKPNTVSKADIRRAEKQGFILIVECSEPESVRFVQPPMDADIPAQSAAALELLRVVMEKDSSTNVTVGFITKRWASILMNYLPPKEPRKAKP